MYRFLPGQLSPLLLSLGYLVLGCGGGGGGGVTPPPTTTIAKASTGSGDAQTGGVGQALALPLKVVVTDGGAASAGATVTWSTTAPSTVDPASVVTDANGLASTRWTLGTVAGSQTARATLSGATGSPVTFSATATPDGALSLAKADGDNQTGQVGAQLATALQAKVADQFGNGVPGVNVLWAATGASVSAPTVPTDGSGVSAINVTLGSTVGPVTITATAASLTGSPLTFNAMATSAPTTASVSVVNNSFNPKAITVAAGTTVTWTWSSTAINHNVSPDGTMPTRSGDPVNGPNSYQFKFDTPGTYQYHCEVHGGPGGIGMSGTVTVQ